MNKRISRLSIGITGSVTNPDQKYSPYTYCHSSEGMELIRQLCDEPVPAGKVEKELREGLELIEAIRVEGGKCYLNFPCFLKKDREILLRVSEAYTQTLTKLIAAQKEEFYRSAAGFYYNQVGAAKYLYFLIGCAALDWKGLALLEDKGLTVVKTRAGANVYTLFGNEAEEGSMKELYWGSHNQYCGAYTLTTFGDHENPRHGFPDIFFRLSYYSFEKLKKIQYHNELYQSFQQMLKDWGDTLLQSLIGSGPSLHRDLLIKLNYLKDDMLNIPVLLVDDKPLVEQVLKKMTVIISEWLEVNYTNLKKDLRDITPLRFGVDYREVFIQVWHYLFAVTNKHLVRSGFFFNPYGPESDWQGYLPVIHVNELKDFWQ
jgi:hypothetical protein